jgi:uncharacterized lipoprotein YajG
MKKLLIVVSTVMFAGCGAEVATTAATGAAIKKQEIETGKQLKEMADKRIDKAAQAIKERTEQQEAAGK